MHGADSTDAVADFEQGKVTRGPVIDMRDKVRESSLYLAHSQPYG